MRITAAFLVLAMGLISVQSIGAEEVVNIYSSRHYDSDDALYASFTQATGIKVNLIEGKADELLARIKREGDLSPADVFIAVDAGRLHKGVVAGIFQPVESSVLNERVPDSLRHPEGLWFGLAVRIRCIFQSRDLPEDYVTTYDQLADPKLAGEVLIRSSSNIYNQSLVSWLVGCYGTQQAQAWADGVVANMARTPQGGDTDQLRALAAGEGKVAVANHYYYAYMLTKGDPADLAAAQKIRLVFPNQDEGGAQVNISGAGVVKSAPNRDHAVKFLEFLSTVEAQELWVSASHEYPVVEGAQPSEVVRSFGEFKADDLNAALLGDHNREAVKVMDRAGWR